MSFKDTKKYTNSCKNFFDGLGPSPSKLQCSDLDTINISEDVNQFISWQSNIQEYSNDNEQFGQGVNENPSESNGQENEKNALSYTLQKKGEKHSKMV